MGLTIVHKSDLSNRKKNPRIALVLAGGAVTGGAYSVTRVTYPALIAAGAPVLAWVTAARWINIDTPAALATTDAELRRQPFQF